MSDKNEIESGAPPSITEMVETPGYDQAASGVSKTYIVLFFIFCGVIGYLDQPDLGQRALYRHFRLSERSLSDWWI